MTALRTGLIGANIGRSRLADGLKIMCHAHDIDLKFEPIDTAQVTAFDFAKTVDTLREKGWSGVTVTHPHKPAAAAYAGAAMDEDVRHLGAANTLTFHPDLRGYNTDYTGFLAAWKGVLGARMPGRVAMAGAGGVARAIAPALLKLGADEVVIWDMSAERAGDLARAIGTGARAIPAKAMADAVKSADGLVNATPLGMAGYGGTAFPPDLIATQAWAFDAVYTPTDTAFLKDAAAQGLTTLSGFDLFRYMAVRSFEAYTGIRPDAPAMLRDLATLRPKEVS